jgi:hypothetical protein
MIKATQNPMLIGPLYRILTSRSPIGSARRRYCSIMSPSTNRFGKNPFTGQEQWFAAKPATVKVKVRALKKLKDAVL